MTRSAAARSEKKDGKAHAAPGLHRLAKTLDQLKTGEKAVVSALRGVGAVQQRLLEMGVCSGAPVEVLRFAPMGDPMVIHVRGFTLALRKSEASLVELES